MSEFLITPLLRMRIYHEETGQVNRLVVSQVSWHLNSRPDQQDSYVAEVVDALGNSIASQETDTFDEAVTIALSLANLRGH